MNARTRRQVGAAVWGAGLAVALLWGAFDAGQAEGVGYGFAPSVEIAALETGRVASVQVSLHDMVTAEQVLVRFDPAPLVAERELAGAKLLAVQEELEREAMGDARRFMESAEGTRIDRALIAAQLAEDRASLATVREQAAIEESLLARGATSSDAVDDWHREIRVLEARIVAQQRALVEATGAEHGARARQESVPGDSPWALVTATREIEMIEGRIARLDLNAGIDGQITWLYRRPGEVVPAGEPVLQVQPRATREVVAFLSPAEAQGRAPGERASIRRATGQVVSGELLSVGVAPQPLPQHLWSFPGWPQHGIPIRVRLDAEIGPNEPVTVRL